MENKQLLEEIKAELKERLNDELDWLQEFKELKDNKSVGYGVAVGSRDTLMELLNWIDETYSSILK